MPAFASFHLWGSYWNLITSYDTHFKCCYYDVRKIGVDNWHWCGGIMRHNGQFWTISGDNDAVEKFPNVEVGVTFVTFTFPSALTEKSPPGVCSKCGENPFCLCILKEILSFFLWFEYLQKKIIAQQVPQLHWLHVDHQMFTIDNALLAEHFRTTMVSFLPHKFCPSAVSCGRITILRTNLD